MADEDEAAEEGEEQKPKGKKKLLMIIIVAVLLLGGGGGGAAFFLLAGSDEAAEGVDGESQKEEAVDLETADLGVYIVNLAEGDHFLKIRILAEYNPALVFGGGGGAGGGAGYGGGFADGGLEGGGLGSLAAREPMIKDSIIKVLSSKTVQEVLTPDGKETLKEELLDAINEATGLDEPPIVALYFTEFIVQ